MRADWRLLCWEHWSDEEGCTVPGPHQCSRIAQVDHRRHICDCGAEMWDVA